MALLSSRPITLSEQEQINRIRRSMRDEDDTVKLSLLLRQLKELLDSRNFEIVEDRQRQDRETVFFRAA
jgi:hypothetical protein